MGWGGMKCFEVAAVPRAQECWHPRRDTEETQPLNTWVVDFWPPILESKFVP